MLTSPRLLCAGGCLRQRGLTDPAAISQCAVSTFLILDKDAAATMALRMKPEFVPVQQVVEERDPVPA